MKVVKVVSRLVGMAALAAPGLAHAERCSDGSDLTEPDRQQKHPNEDCIERNIYMMPGVFGAFFAPTGAAGPFYGAGVQISPYQWSHNNDRFGPSQGGIFFNAAFLQSAKSSGTLALFEGGINASLERNSSRRYLIPYFGGSIGGLTQPELGTSGYVYPFAGMHLYHHRNLMVDAEGGYHFPFEDIDRVKGARANLSARFSLW